MLPESDVIRSGVLRVAELMVVAAKTAPKARGIDNIVSVVISDPAELEDLARKMEELASKYGSFFERDAKCVRESDAVVIIGAKVVDIGVKAPKDLGIGMDTYMTIVNLGIAIGSAVKVASMLNVDNRIMYSIGVAAKELGLIDADYVLGIPLSVKGKNIYFDRFWWVKK